MLSVKISAVILFICLFGFVLFTGCLEDPIDNVPQNTFGMQQINNNTYYVVCDSTDECASYIGLFEQSHNVVAFAPCTNGAYGATSGYFFITK